MKEIASLLVATNEPGSENQLTTDEIAGWLREYLDSHEEELLRFPSTSDSAHWDLIAADYDTSRPAVFVIAMFDRDLATFVAGRGDAVSVREFGESGFPDDPLKVIPAATSRFQITGQVAMSKFAISSWLGK